jgi:flotillin
VIAAARVGEAVLVWFWLFIAFVVVATLLAWFLHRFYAKAALDVALVRTGLGGRRVVVDSGCLALPIVHRLQKVSLEAVVIAVALKGRDAAMCRDQLRADLGMEFEVRVEPSPLGVATAAQSLGARIARSSEALADMLHGIFIDAIQSAAAARSLDEIHVHRSEFTRSISDDVEERLQRLGLEMVSASLVSVDQSAFSQTDENNAFHAQGMRRLAEIVADQRKARVQVETETEIAVRSSRLAQHQRQLEMQRAEQESEIAHREYLSRAEAEAASRSSQIRAEADLLVEAARIGKERDAKAAQVASDEAIRKAEMAAALSVEETRIDNDIKLSRKRAAESAEKAKEESARVQLVLAVEDVQAQKDRAVAERERVLAQLRQEKELSLDDAQVRSEVETMLARAKAKASAASLEAGADKVRMEAEAAGRTALYSAENSLSDSVIRMRLEERKLDRLPEIMTQMMKPVEKIESIRINQIGGLGEAGAGGAGRAGAEGAFASAMDQILSMAVRLPAMKQMGKEIGLDFEPDLAGRTADFAGKIKGKIED